MSLQLVIAGLRALSVLAPNVIRVNHGDRISGALDSIATLLERGEEGVNELKALVEKIQAMDGVVDRQALEDMWTNIEDTSRLIQEAAKRIPIDPIPVDPPPADPAPADTPTPAPDTGAGDGGADAGNSGDAGGSGGDSQSP